MTPVLSLRGLRKQFGGTVAVHGFDLDLYPGEILALLGQNGAGKSTVIKMLAGVHLPDSGEMFLAGRRFDPAAERHAISFIHQDLGLIEWMTVAENVALAEGYRRRGGLIDWRGMAGRARSLLAAIAPDIDPESRVQDLTRTEKSLVAIARAVGREARVLVLDEPTASLPQDEVDHLFQVLRELKGRGVAMIYVSHRLDEIFAIADRMVVLRDGRTVDSRPTVEAEPDQVVRTIIGRPPDSLFVRPPRPRPDDVLRLEELKTADAGPVDLTVHSGEIVGLAGLRGAGQESIGRALVGAVPKLAGHVWLAGARPNLDSPTEAIHAGVGFVAGDRIAESVGHGLSVRENMFLNPAATDRHSFAWRQPAAEAAEAAMLGQRVHLAPNDPAAPIETLSGGNQQKVVMARWLRIGGRVLVLEDPTAGVDVGAKAEIYRLLAEAVGQGLAVILISTDFEEVAAICHRALVFRDGRIVAELDGTSLEPGLLLAAASLAPPPFADPFRPGQR
ncbi:sugar ABC transporter ATP-binding protein [Geminicoccus flavidas]|uniref:sugar ABC transporter ATP-binding protein n=1 Tax=Geminicoccus flavidas TaxID=2506407 RepID=UPI00135968EB|nr:sugar ABC transporter ATP-binding protein [Geminicoccus flavidas]